LIAAAYLHDLGYAPALVETGFHGLDGARHLRALGQERLAGLVAYHSGARCEAELRGRTAELAEFTDEASPTSMALTYCDMTTGPAGEVVTYEERLAGVEGRYGADTSSLAPCAMLAPRSSAAPHSWRGGCARLRRRSQAMTGCGR
jgi:hypothetical protein